MSDLTLIGLPYLPSLQDMLHLKVVIKLDKVPSYVLTLVYCSIPGGFITGVEVSRLSQGTTWILDKLDRGEILYYTG